MKINKPLSVTCLVNAEFTQHDLDINYPPKQQQILTQPNPRLKN